MIQQEMKGNAIMDIRETVDRIIHILFPPRCLSCDEVVYYQDMFCGKCGYERASPETCLEKMRDVRVSGVVAGALYSGGLRNAIWTIKDKQDIRTRDFFAGIMLEEIRTNWPGFAPDYITPVPLSPDKLRARGFNQAGLLAKKLSLLLGVSYADNVLFRDNDSQTQHTLSIPQREENAVKSYHIADSRLVSGKVILLVDDVLTTGATLRACASLLIKSGAKAVYAAAAAYTPDSDKSDYNALDAQ